MILLLKVKVKITVKTSCFHDYEDSMEAEIQLNQVICMTCL